MKEKLTTKQEVKALLESGGYTYRDIAAKLNLIYRDVVEIIYEIETGKPLHDKK